MILEDIHLTAADGRSFSGYLARPIASPAPGIVLMQEIFGVNAFMRCTADRFAAAGFLVLVPDLFWREKPGIQLDSGREEDRALAMELRKQLNIDLAIDDCVRALSCLRELPGANGKVGTVGFCLGGKLAYLMAARSSTDAAVGYYGVGIQDLLAEAHTIRRPLMLHIAGEDHLCPPPAQQTIIEGLRPLRALASIHTYAGASHGFARRGGPAYDEASARTADRRTVEFLRQHLG